MLALTDRLRWPRLLLIVSAVFAVAGYLALPRGLHIYLYALLGLSSLGYLYARWDETRGQAAALEALRTQLMSSMEASREGDVMHTRLNGSPLILKVSAVDQELQVSVLTPLPESSLAFRLYAKGKARPPLDGGAMALGAADLEELPGLSATLPPTLGLEGNAPAQISQLFDSELRDALSQTMLAHTESFRGLSFDGRFLAAHWTGPLTSNGLDLVHVSYELFAPFLPNASVRPILLS